MVEKVSNERDLTTFLEERKLAQRLRDAISFCKNSLDLGSVLSDHNMKHDERVALENCLTSNYLVKEGMDYFGKRDLIYIDLYGSDDVRNLRQSI
jgi:hypothetical protein